MRTGRVASLFLVAVVLLAQLTVVCHADDGWGNFGKDGKEGKVLSKAKQKRRDGAEFTPLQKRLNRLVDKLLKDVGHKDVNSTINEIRTISQPLLEKVPKAPQLLQKIKDVEVLSEKNQTLTKNIAHGGYAAPEVSGMDASADALFLLAVLSSYGILGDVVQKDEQWAVHALHSAKIGGNWDAQLALGERYIEGRGVPKNCDTGVHLIKDIAQDYVRLTEERGAYDNPLEPINLRYRWMDPGYKTVKHNQHGQHVIEYQSFLAAGGDVARKRHLGWRMMMGMGMEKDHGEAFRTFLQLSEQGDRVSTYNLGYMYNRGLYVRQNFTKAREYWLEAAKRGYVGALIGVGGMYFRGTGVKLNYTKAKEYFEWGNMMGDADCITALAAYYQTGNYGEPTDWPKAYELYTEATVLGHWRAPYNLATMCLWGQGKDPNCTAASKHIRKYMNKRHHFEDRLDAAELALKSGQVVSAIVQYLVLAEQGCEAAMSNAAFLLQKTEVKGLQNRYELALDLFMRSGKHGNYASLVAAGNMHFYGDLYDLPCGRNVELAGELYERAVHLNYTEGMYNLGWMYQHGIGKEKNITQAELLYKRAISRSWSEGMAIPPFFALTALRASKVIPSLDSILLSLSQLPRRILAIKKQQRQTGELFNAPDTPDAMQTDFLSILGRFENALEVVDVDTLLLTGLMLVFGWIVFKRRQLAAVNRDQSRVREGLRGLRMALRNANQVNQGNGINEINGNRENRRGDAGQSGSGLTSGNPDHNDQIDEVDQNNEIDHNDLNDLNDQNMGQGGGIGEGSRHSSTLGGTLDYSDNREKVENGAGGSCQEVADRNSENRESLR